MNLSHELCDHCKASHLDKPGNKSAERVCKTCRRSFQRKTLIQCNPLAVFGLQLVGKNLILGKQTGIVATALGNATSGPAQYG